MKSFLSLMVVLLVGLSLFVGIGVGIGFALNWLLPAIDPGIGALIGVVALAFTLQTLTRLMELPVEVEEDDEETVEPGNVAFVIEELGKKGKQRRKGGGH